MACERNGARKQTSQASAGRIAGHILTATARRVHAAGALPTAPLTTQFNAAPDVDAGASAATKSMLPYPTRA